MGPKEKDFENRLLLGSATLVIGSFFLIIFNSLGISGNLYYYYYTRIINIIISITLGCCILIASVYYYYRKKFSIFGYLLCIVGSISTISFQIFISLITNSYYSLIYGIKPFLFGILVITGLILNQRGNEIGSKICMVLGAIDLILQVLPLVQGGFIYILIYVLRGGFLNIYITFQFEPLLILIGGYFLYYERVSFF